MSSHEWLYSSQVVVFQSLADWKVLPCTCMCVCFQYHLCSPMTRALLLSTYIKFVNLFPEIKPQIQEVFRQHSNLRSADAELQQRASEYLQLSIVASTDVLVCDIILFIHVTVCACTLYWCSELNHKQFNLLKPNDIYICRTAALTSRCYILNIYSTNIHTEYFKHAA